MTLDKEKKAALRSRIFRHLDGIATAPTIHCLNQAGVLEKILSEDSISLNSLTGTFNANAGYLNVALRVLCSQGWLTHQISEDEGDILYKVTERGKIAFTYAKCYEQAVLFVPQAIRMDDYLLHGFDSGTFSSLYHLFERYRNNWEMSSKSGLEGEVQEQILAHLEGLVAGPLIVGLGRSGLFHNYFSVAPFHVSEFGRHHRELKAILDFFVDMGWLTTQNDIYNFTTEGLYLAKRASAYGVTVSYLPTFLRLQDLVFGDPGILWSALPGSPEIHVNRAMNVWGSGGAHSGYFKKVDEIIINIFNKPIEMQPKGFVDVGCGNGMLIEHIFEVIWQYTERGKVLDEFPLFIVGTDFNQAALEATRETLNNGDIWAKVIWGDISDPDFLAKDLKEKYMIDLGDLLNVRSFLDHNRIYREPEEPIEVFQNRSTGAFSFRGKRLQNRAVMQSLSEHLSRWAPYVKKFGLLVIELHTVDPEITASHLGKIGVTAYDATHGYSDQYILEYSCFLESAHQAGLLPVEKYESVYPRKEMASISINLLKEGTL